MGCIESKIDRKYNQQKHVCFEKGIIVDKDKFKNNGWFVEVITGGDNRPHIYVYDRFGTYQKKVGKNLENEYRKNGIFH